MVSIYDLFQDNQCKPIHECVCQVSIVMCYQLWHCNCIFSIMAILLQIHSDASIHPFTYPLDPSTASSLLHPAIYQSTTHPPTHPCIYPPTHVSIHPPTYLFTDPSIHPPYSSRYLSIHPHTQPPNPLIYSPIHPSTHPHSTTLLPPHINSLIHPTMSLKSSPISISSIDGTLLPQIIRPRHA